MKKRKTILCMAIEIIILFGIAVGCSDEMREEQSRTITEIAQETESEERNEDGWNLALEGDKDSGRVGDLIDFTIYAENTGSEMLYEIQIDFKEGEYQTSLAEICPGEGVMFTKNETNKLVHSITEEDKEKGYYEAAVSAQAQYYGGRIVKKTDTYKIKVEE